MMSWWELCLIRPVKVTPCLVYQREVGIELTQLDIHNRRDFPALPTAPRTRCTRYLDPVSPCPYVSDPR